MAKLTRNERLGKHLEADTNLKGWSSQASANTFGFGDTAFIGLCAGTGKFTDEIINQIASKLIGNEYWAKIVRYFKRRRTRPRP